ncbi:MAG TPA: dihydrolipoamide acetyltransferase family protein [Steroidobacteraceae bacterium]|nr:dihydrolipoamide acetyltransferase family protein [Steroidobacteraceae bacterium]
MSSALDIRAPAEQTEGTRSQLLRWLKRPGERVTENEPLIELETDKVTVEVASPGSGVLREILKHEQDEIAPGELLGRIEVGSPEAAGAGGAARGGASAVPPGAQTYAVEAAAPGAAQATGPAQRAAAEPSPAVRRLLTERGLTAAAVHGTGPGGRITVEDVLRAASGNPVAGVTDAAPVTPPPAAESAAGVRRVPHTALRKRIAEHMVQSLLHTAPHVTTVFEADMSAVLKDRTRRREEFARHGVPLTFTAYFVQAAVAAIRAVPEANSRWTPSALEIHESIHIGIATAVEGSGLLVPVLRDADTRDLLETARGIDELVTRARAGTLAPADVRGGTFTISNHGVSGSLLAAPIIINQPQSAILGVGRLEKRAVVVEEGDEQKIVVQPRCYVTLTLDHRVMDGHQANHFLQTLVARLADWSA